MVEPGFTFRANAISKFWDWFLAGLTLCAGFSLLLVGIILVTQGDEASILCFTYGVVGIGWSIFIVLMIRGSQYVIYEDKGDHLSVSFGPGNCLNCTMNTCCYWNCMDGKIYYADMKAVKVLESTSCCDGCGVNHSHSRAVTYSTGCCVPALEIQSTQDRKHCCFSGRILLGVESQDQAIELRTFFHDYDCINSNAP